MSRYNFLFKRDLSHRAVSVYLYLANMADENNECWPAIPTIARDVKLSESTVRRAIQDLREAGLVETTRRYRESGGDSSLLYQLQKG